MNKSWHHPKLGEFVFFYFSSLTERFVTRKNAEKREVVKSKEPPSPDHTYVDKALQTTHMSTRLLTI
jgi:hypothetical protein